MPNNGAPMAGKVVGVQGPVVDVQFPTLPSVPDIYNVIYVTAMDGRRVTLEVNEHLPGNVARCIAIQSTLNMQRHAIAMPSGGVSGRTASSSSPPKRKA